MTIVEWRSHFCRIQLFFCKVKVFLFQIKEVKNCIYYWFWQCFIRFIIICFDYIIIYIIKGKVLLCFQSYFVLCFVWFKDFLLLILNDGCIISFFFVFNNLLLIWWVLIIINIFSLLVLYAVYPVVFVICFSFFCSSSIFLLKN